MDLYNTYFAYDDSILMIDVKRVLKLFRVFHTHNNNNKGTGNTKNIMLKDTKTLHIFLNFAG